MKNIYRHPTVRKLAAALADTGDAPTERPAPEVTEQPASVSTFQYLPCGTLQLLVFLGYAYAAVVLTLISADWPSAAADPVQTYESVVVLGGAACVLCLLPIAAKWILVGRWQETDFPAWGLTYLRFWILKALLHANPMLLFDGNPLHGLFLRVRCTDRQGSHDPVQQHPVCTDLLSIGEGSIIRKDSIFHCCRARAGRIETGRLTLSPEVYVGDKTVLARRACNDHSDFWFKGST